MATVTRGFTVPTTGCPSQQLPQGDCSEHPCFPCQRHTPSLVALFGVAQTNHLSQHGHVQTVRASTAYPSRAGHHTRVLTRSCNSGGSPRCNTNAVLGELNLGWKTHPGKGVTQLDHGLKGRQRLFGSESSWAASEGWGCHGGSLRREARLPGWVAGPLRALPLLHVSAPEIHLPGTPRHHAQPPGQTGHHNGPAALQDLRRASVGKPWPLSSGKDAENKPWAAPVGGGNEHPAPGRGWAVSLQAIAKSFPLKVDFALCITWERRSAWDLPGHF